MFSYQLDIPVCYHEDIKGNNEQELIFSGWGCVGERKGQWRGLCEAKTN